MAWIYISINCATKCLRTTWYFCNTFILATTSVSCIAVCVCTIYVPKSFNIFMYEFLFNDKHWIFSRMLCKFKRKEKKKKTNSLSTPQYYSTVFHCEMKIKYVRLSKIGVKRALTSKFYILDFFHYWLRVPWNTFIPLSIKQTSEEKKKKKSLLSPYFSSESRTEISFLIFKLSIPPYLFWPMPMISDIL